MATTIHVGAAVILVDDEDYDALCAHRWYLLGRGRWRYAYNRHIGLMHRLIVKAAAECLVDHINGDTFDNRKENLRLVTRQQNSMNRGASRNNTSGRRGVTYHRSKQKWQAQIQYEGRNRYLGLFETVDEASRAYRAAASELFGEYARKDSEP